MGPIIESVESQNCRICFEGDNDEDDSKTLVKSPCNCSGSMSQLHMACLETWLQTSQRTKCEICHYNFQTIRVFPSFRDYIRDPKNRVCIQLGTLLVETLSFLLPTTVLWLMAYQWYTDRTHKNSTAKNNQDFFAEWEGITLFFGSFALLSALYIWSRGTFRHYQFVWNSWRLSHQQIQVVIPTTGQEEIV